jgi:hypothetical protein
MLLVPSFLKRRAEYEDRRQNGKMLCKLVEIDRLQGSFAPSDHVVNAAVTGSGTLDPTPTFQTVSEVPQLFQDRSLSAAHISSPSDSGFLRLLGEN